MILRQREACPRDDPRLAISTTGHRSVALLAVGHWDTCCILCGLLEMYCCLYSNLLVSVVIQWGTGIRGWWEACQPSSKVTRSY